MQEASEFPAPARMLQFAQRLRLDLADALARHVELLADLFRAVGVHADRRGSGRTRRYHVVAGWHDETPGTVRSRDSGLAVLAPLAHGLAMIAGETNARDAVRLNAVWLASPIPALSHRRSDATIALPLLDIEVGLRKPIYFPRFPAAAIPVDIGIAKRDEA